MRFDVTEADTAISLGSGDVPVLATPRLVAWLEAATVSAAGAVLTSRRTSVGIGIRIEHLRATPVGGWVEVTATLVGEPGRQLTFQVSATDGEGQPVAQGQIVRAVVDRERFMAGLSPRPGTAANRREPTNPGPVDR